jgi:hypothetical protein
MPTIIKSYLISIRKTTLNNLLSIDFIRFSYLIVI